MEVLLLLLLILINGFFAMSEIGLVSARRARLQSLVDAGDGGARVAAELGSEPTRFLSTIQIGITSVGLLSGIMGEATLAPPVAAELQHLGLGEQAAEVTATGIVVALITYFSIVLGELVPKRVGQMHAETVARLVSRPIALLATASKPFVWLLTRSTSGLLRVLGINDRGQSAVTEDEINAVLAEGSAAGVIEADEHRMVRNLFRLDDQAVVTIMTPRVDIVGIDVGVSRAELLAIIESAPHSTYPLCRDGIDDVIGVISLKRLLQDCLADKPLDLEASAETPLYIPESIKGMELLDSFRKSNRSFAFVVDEYGGVLGLVTLHDLLEAITGEITDPAAQDGWAVQREDGSWLLEGQIPIVELLDRLAPSGPDVRDATEYQTLSGLVLARLGRIPATADRITWADYAFEIVDMDGRRIDKILATRLTRPDQAVDPTAALPRS
jgi:putative hemolysin